MGALHGQEQGPRQELRNTAHRRWCLSQDLRDQLQQHKQRKLCVCACMRQVLPMEEKAGTKPQVQEPC